MRTTFVMAALCVFGSASAAPARPFTLYSDVCYNREGGDVLGTRIGILRLPEASYLYLQFAQGDFEAPQMIKLGPGDLNGGRLTFSAQIVAKGPQSVFHGRVTDAMLMGAFDDHAQGPSGNARFNLRQSPPDKKGFPDCK
ncbi:MAG TPA: hypothetical protein VGH23_11140 [Rhizomicrobium sp.]|jgi:hypothetical protein